jgi:type IV pilus assembly protein PilX
MKTTFDRRQRALGAASRQRGVVLFIALIVLVAMTMAGIAIMRSVDTGNLISGNVAFKQGTLQAGDNGANTAITYLEANAYTGNLDNDDPAEAFYSVATEPPDWGSQAVWDNAKLVGTDANGNTVEYLIHRLCEDPGAPGGVNCAKSQKTGGEAGNSQGAWGASFQAQPMVLYRVTTRVTGPRDTTSIIQFNIAVQH